LTRAAVHPAPGHSAVRTDVPLALVGPTASGKTEASVELARRLQAEVILIDSMTVYRGMDVGTAKPPGGMMDVVPHHLVDVADPTEPFSVARFQRLARQALTGVRGRGRPALLVGGSGLYFRAVVDDLELPGTDPRLRRALEAEAAVLGARRLHERLAGFDPAAAARIDPGNARRTVRALEVAALTGRGFSSFARSWDRYPPDRVRAAGVAVPAAVLRARIEDRIDRQLQGGLVEEVRALVERGFGPFLTASQAIGYLEVVEHLNGRMSLEAAREKMIRRTRGLARRQASWFRRDPRITWFTVGPGGAAEAVDEIEEYLRA
jgi:tRNA dimethylallyltransferase